MRDLKIGNQANGKGKKVGGCKDGYKKKYNRKLGRYTCEKIEERNPRRDGVLPKKETTPQINKKKIDLKKK